MTFCEASTIRDGIHAAHPQGYQVGMTNTARWGWVLKIQHRGAGPQDPTLPLFTSLPVWVCLIGDWPNAAERLEIDTALVEQMGGSPIGGEAVPPSAELGRMGYSSLALAGERSGKCACAGGSCEESPSARPNYPQHPKGEPVCP